MKSLGLNNSFFEKHRQATIVLAYIYCFLLIGAMTIYGVSPLLYVGFAFITALFILPNHFYLTLPITLTMTMIFERFYTLQSLVVDRMIYKLYPIDIVMALGFFAFLLSLKINRRPIKFIFGWPEKTLAVFMALVALYFLRAIFDINSSFAVAFSSFKNYLWYPLLYFFTVYTIQTKTELKKISHLILINGVAIIGFILIGFMRGQGLWTEFTPLSTAGVRYLAGTHAFYLLLCLGLGVSLLAYDRLRSRGFAFLIGAFWCLGITVSLMRHLWLDTVLAMALLFIILPKDNKKFLSKYAAKISLALISIAALITLIAGLFYFSGFSETFREQLNNVSNRAVSLIDLSEDTSANWRLELWYDAQKAWIKNPILGIGLGKSILLDRGDWQNLEEIRNIHNSFLALMIQMGLVGLAAFIALIIASGLAALKWIYKNEDLTPYYLGLGVGCAIFLFASLFQPYLETNLMNVMFWIFLGLLRTSAVINKYEDSLS